MSSDEYRIPPQRLIKTLQTPWAEDEALTGISGRKTW